MSTALQPESSTTVARFGDLSWMDDEHDIYRTNKAAWEREERRLYGGDAVLGELARFDGETDASYLERKAAARYVRFPQAHVASVTGTLSSKRPMPGEGLSLGGLGDVRKRGSINSRRSFAELFWYNCDGVGDDGSEFPAFMDAVDERAQATGHRWVRVESPAGSGNDGRLTVEQVERGQRPFLVEDSPLVWHNWLIVNGELQWAVGRVPVTEPKVEGGRFTAQSTTDGYYLFVRSGYKNLGTAFADGGWFLFDSEKEYMRSGTWARTRGQIPMAIAYGQKSPGCKGYPAMSQSATMELGQIAVGLMNTVSARLYDFWDACASKLFFLNAGPKEMKEVAEQANRRSLYIGVPPVESEGDKALPVTLYDGSLGAVAAAVAESLIKATYEEAREQSFQQITSTPDSSGESKMAGFREQKSPFLAKRARYRQQLENSLIRWTEQRFGVPEPSGFSQWTTDYDNAPLVDAIDAGYDTLKRAGLKSRTAMVGMALMALEKRGLVTDENRDLVRVELEASFDATEERANAERDALRGFGGGAE